jgi:hypothetical protein
MISNGALHVMLYVHFPPGNLWMAVCNTTSIKERMEEETV